MRLNFTKMHGLGNDFVVFNGIAQRVVLFPEQIRHIADRHFGIGCDQILLVEKSDLAAVDFRYRIFNADGGEVEQCGNGARCFARFVQDQGLTAKQTITVQTHSGVITLQVQADGQVSVDMGVPEFLPDKIPFIAEAQHHDYALEVDGQHVSIGAVSMGNPHAVLRVANMEQAPVATLGPAIEHHPRFPRRVNVGFMEIISPHAFALRVFERGVGETLACGTGACAAMVIGRTWNLLGETATARLRGGTLVLHWQGPGTPVMMTGPAQTVFEGSIDL